MSAATTGAAIGSHGSSRHMRWPKPEPIHLKLVQYGAFALVSSFLLFLTPAAIGSMRADRISLLAWLAAVGVTDLLSVPLWGTTLALSLPILLAAGMVYPPTVAAALALIGTTDPRELRREISLGRSLYNRSQIALSVMAGSWVFHLAGGNLNTWPVILLIALAALVVDSAVNFSLLTIGWRIANMGGVREAVGRIFGREPFSFVLSYICLGLSAVIVAVVYTEAGAWGLVAFVVPVLLGQQAFAQRARLIDLAEAISEKNRALLTVSEKMAEERRDERLAVAAGLHDDLLPPLYQVHLMGQVLRQDLATGRLLDLEIDLPQLVGATQRASEATQALIRGLRHSGLGPGGLVGTLRLLARDMQSTSPSEIRLDVDDVGGSPLIQLLAYQVAREALRNAVRHAEASRIEVALTRDGSDMRLVIADDGQGFDPRSVDSERHFGLQLMKERVELAGGVLHLESSTEEGTRIVVRLPAETSAQAN